MASFGEDRTLEPAGLKFSYGGNLALIDKDLHDLSP